MRKAIIVATSIAILATSVGIIFNSNDEPNEHAGHTMQTDIGAMPKETGQSAFAAIAEIVAILESDENTDWTRVYIQALRDHLIDMNDVTMRSQVTSKKAADDIVFTITGDADVAEAIKRMVPAHAMELDKMSDWSASTTILPNGVALQMTPINTQSAAKIAALGFYGLLATGAHHQPHHLGMANGSLVH